MVHPAPRGACPTLAEPMAVADGLLVRFRPASGLDPDQVIALAAASADHGNGLIEVTARGSIQVRGLTKESEEGFRAALDGAGIEAMTGPSVECSPIAGEDPKERADPRALAESLRIVAREVLSHGALSPKLSIVLATGGQVALDALKADIRLIAQPQGWVLEVGGDTVGLVTERDAAATVRAVLAELQQIGPRARGSDLDRFALQASLEATSPLPPTYTRPVSYTVGPMVLTGQRPALRIGLPFGQVRAYQLKALGETMARFKVRRARPAPDRTMVLSGFETAALHALSPALSGAGYWTRGDAEGTRLGVCSGAEGTAGQAIHAAQLAAALLAVDTDLVDGSFHLHVSTCAKGCAHPNKPGLMLKGTEIFRFEQPHKRLATLDPAAIENGILDLARRIRDARQKGDSTLDALMVLEAQ
ncbi:hypothetical protein [Pelagibacterium montanilacus]|uniref:hypothetical protein n=1 Tax=Pelagibacterium montanilacus TaxID=2185280 RepID=UPI0013DE9B55|nr:hypothetical protein [Pelagibacterium montanilacus]